MTTDKNCSRKEANFDYYTVTGCYGVNNINRMSPSSWDDSEEEEEELTDTNSTLDSNDMKQTRFYDASATNEALEDEEDRRQSSARVRRRKKDLTKSSFVLPGTNVCNNFIAWDDRDNDGLTFNTEMYLDEWNFSQSFLKCPKFTFHNYGNVNTRCGYGLAKTGEESENFRNLNVKLSRIVEVDEPKSDLSFGITDNLQFLMATMNRSEEFNSNNNVTRVEELTTTREETTSPGEEKDKMLLSVEDDVEIFMQDKKNAVRPELKKNFDDLYYGDIKYFDNTVIYFFEAEDSVEKLRKARSSNYEEGDGLYFGKQMSRDYFESTAKIEENELFQSFREVNSVEGRNYVEDKISIDKVDDVSNCTDTTHESGTPKRHGNLTGREKEHALSKESFELGLENLFSQTRQTSSVPSTSKHDHGMLLSTSYDLIQNDECFLKDVPLAYTDKDPFSRHLTQFDFNSPPKSPLPSRIINPQGTAAFAEASSSEYIENEDSKCELFFKFLRKYPSDIKSLCGDESKVDEIDEESIKIHNKSKSSSKSNITLDLDGSDKSFTTQMKIYGDSFSEMESSVTSERAKNNGKSPSSIIRKSPKKEKPSATRSNRTDDASTSDQIQISLPQIKVGFGDFETAEHNTVRNADHPQDRGDMKFESYSVKSEWGRLIVQLDERCRINRPVKSIFRIDVQENLRTKKGESHQDMKLNPVKSFERFDKSAKGGGGTWKITKAKKRKRETASVYDACATGITTNIGNSNNGIIKENWLVNKLSARRRALRRGAGSLKTFLIMRGRRQDRKKRRYRHKNQTPHLVDSTTGGTDCFRTLFKQLVNFFTLFCHRNRH